MFLKVGKYWARVVGNDSAPLHRPSHVDDLTSVPAQVFLHGGAQWFGVRNGSAVETAKGTRLMVDFSLHLIKGSPSANRKQARSNCVQDSNTSQEETDYVVVDVVSSVNALHPAAK